MTSYLNDHFNKYSTFNENGKCQMLFAFAPQIREKQINPSLEMLQCDPSQMKISNCCYPLQNEPCMLSMVFQCKTQPRVLK